MQIVAASLSNSSRLTCRAFVTVGTGGNKVSGRGGGGDWKKLFGDSECDVTTYAWTC
jgi:hypothetical protein